MQESTMWCAVLCHSLTPTFPPPTSRRPHHTISFQILLAKDHRLCETHQRAFPLASSIVSDTHRPGWDFHFLLLNLCTLKYYFWKDLSQNQKYFGSIWEYGKTVRYFKNKTEKNLMDFLKKEDTLLLVKLTDGCCPELFIKDFSRSPEKSLW